MSEIVKRHEDCDLCHVTHDCEDCGTLHSSWSAQERYRERALELSGDIIETEIRIRAALADVDLEVAARALEQVLRDVENRR